jgi:putative transposase
MRRPCVTYHVLFFLNLESRRVTLAGMTRHPTEAWMLQMARNVDETSGCLCNHRYLLHDRDAKFCAAAPNLNAFAERWVRSVKEECLSKLVLFGESSLHRALNEFIANFHSERNHQGKGNVLLFPCSTTTTTRRKLHCRERLGGLLQ